MQLKSQIVCNSEYTVRTSWSSNVTLISGRVSHSREAATGKARSPIVERRVRRTISDDVEAERRH